MSSPLSQAELPRTEAESELLGAQQLVTLESLASYDPTNPSHDARTAVAARYVLDEQLARGHTPDLSTYGDYQARLKQTREGRQNELLDERVRRITPPTPPDPNNFDELMAASVAAEVEKDLRKRHGENLESQVYETIARTALTLSDAQVDWEVSHGTVNAVNHTDLQKLERQGHQMVEAGIRAARRAFSRRRAQTMTPEELTQAMKYPTDAAGTMISELVAGGVLKRDAANDSLSLEPIFQPRNYASWRVSAPPQGKRRRFPLSVRRPRS